MIDTKLSIQNGRGVRPLFWLQSNSGPLARGPIDRAKQLKAAAVPFTRESFEGLGTTLVNLKSCKTSVHQCCTLVGLSCGILQYRTTRVANGNKDDPDRKDDYEIKYREVFGQCYRQWNESVK